MPINLLDLSKTAFQLQLFAYGQRTHQQTNVNSSVMISGTSNNLFATIKQKCNWDLGLKLQEIRVTAAVVIALLLLLLATSVIIIAHQTYQTPSKLVCFCSEDQQMTALQPFLMGLMALSTKLLYYLGYNLSFFRKCRGHNSMMHEMKKWQAFLLHCNPMGHKVHRNVLQAYYIILLLMKWRRRKEDPYNILISE